MRGSRVAGITRRAALAALAGCLLLASAQAPAEPMRKPVRIGELSASWGPTPSVAGVRDGLIELGYREDLDFVLGVRFTQGELPALSLAARELVDDGADILVAVGDSAARAAREATRRHPIVFVAVGDPVRAGWVDSYARPGGNLTGVADYNPALSGKRLELFKELIPGLRKVWAPYVDGYSYQMDILAHYREAARTLDVELVALPLRNQNEAREAILALRKGQVDGILAPRDPELNIAGFVLEATTRHGIPSMFEGDWYAEHGGLASYSPSLYGDGRLAARIVDKIMRGIDPAEIPVEVNHKIEYVINLKVARALGLELPRVALYRADRLIR